MASIADERLTRLAELVGARKVTPATIRVVDVPGTGPALLGGLRQVDAILAVADGFSAGADPAADLETLELELLVADRDHVERRLERVEKQAKSGDAALRKEADAAPRAARAPRVRRLVARLPGRAPAELEPLTTKPLLAVENGPGGIDLQLEAELAELPDEEAAASGTGRPRSTSRPASDRRARPDHLLHGRRQGDARVDAATGSDGARGRCDDPLRHRAGFIRCETITLERSARRGLARRGGAPGDAAARGEDLRRPGR